MTIIIKDEDVWKYKAKRWVEDNIGWVVLVFIVWAIATYVSLGIAVVFIIICFVLREICGYMPSVRLE